MGRVNQIIKAKKYVFITLGIISVVLGVAGIVIPVLPTTPFLLLSSFLFYKSSDKFYNWLINHKTFGVYIYNYKTYKAISKKDKIVTLVMLYTTMSISFYLINNLYVRILLAVIAIGVTIHILSMNTLENKKK